MNKLDIRNIRLVDFNNNFNKTRQSALDVIEREGGRPCFIPTLAKKITSELAEVMDDGRLESMRGFLVNCTRICM